MSNFEFSRSYRFFTFQNSIKRHVVQCVCVCACVSLVLSMNERLLNGNGGRQSRELIIGRGPECCAFIYRSITKPCAFTQPSSSPPPSLRTSECYAFISTHTHTHGSTQIHRHTLANLIRFTLAESLAACSVNGFRLIWFNKRLIFFSFLSFFYFF